MYKINVFQYFATIKGIQNYPYFFNAFLHKFKKKKKLLNLLTNIVIIAYLSKTRLHVP